MGRLGEFLSGFDYRTIISNNRRNMSSAEFTVSPLCPGKRIDARQVPISPANDTIGGDMLKDRFITLYTRSRVNTVVWVLSFFFVGKEKSPVKFVELFLAEKDHCSRHGITSLLLLLLLYHIFLKKRTGLPQILYPIT